MPSLTVASQDVCNYLPAQQCLEMCLFYSSRLRFVTLPNCLLCAVLVIIVYTVPQKKTTNRILYVTFGYLCIFVVARRDCSSEYEKLQMFCIGALRKLWWWIWIWCRYWLSTEYCLFYSMADKLYWWSTLSVCLSHTNISETKRDRHMVTR